MQEISVDKVQEYIKDFSKKESNMIIARTINKVGMKALAINEKTIKDNKTTFNLSLPVTKIYNQYNSNSCWIFSALRVIKPNIAFNLKTDLKDLDLSASYFRFYDLLEKANIVINEVTNNQFDLKKLNNLINYKINTNGIFHDFTKLVKKYGIVPTKFMREANKTYDNDVLLSLFKELIKTECIKLNKLEDKTNAIDEIINKITIFLSKTIGVPPLLFDYKYKNKQGKTIKLKNITPIYFAEKFLTLNLDEFITVTSFDLADLKDTYSYFPSQYLKDDEVIIQKSILEINKMIVNQLKFGLPVWFSSETSLFKDIKHGIFSTKIYNFAKYLDIEFLEKEESLKFDSTNYDHAMVITGVNIENNKITRYKVEDSFGESKYRHGYFTMFPDFFDKYVITVIIDKRFIG